MHPAAAQPRCATGQLCALAFADRSSRLPQSLCCSLLQLWPASDLIPASDLFHLHLTPQRPFP